MIDVIEYLSNRSKKNLILSNAFLVVLIGFLDYLTGLDIGFSIFYLFPISLITWFVGIWIGAFTSFISAVIWLIVDLTKSKTYSHQFTPYWNAFVRLAFFLVIVFLQNAFKNEHLRSRTDPLTKAGNRRFFFEILDNELIRSKRYNHPFTVAYIDIDNFKDVNDSFGHNIVDKLLMSVARTIKNNIRAIDIFARLGGDEFIVLLPETRPESAPKVLQKLHEKLIIAMKQNKWPVTFSIGVVTFAMPPASGDDVVKYADNIMYSVKTSGKNRIEIRKFEKQD